MKKKFVVAQIVKPQGIKGEVKLKPLVSDPSELLDVEKVFISENSESALDVTKVWRYKDNVFMALDGITTRNEAETLRGKKLFIDADEVKELEEGVYYISDLVGCQVVDQDGNELGKVHEVLQLGAADVYVIKGEKNLMMPALKKVIKDTDIEAKKITVDLKTLSEVAVYED